MYAGEIVERGTARRHLLSLRASVHDGPARCDASSTSNRAPSSAAHRRQPARPVRTAGRLRLLRTLPARDAGVPHGTSAADSPSAEGHTSRCWLHHPNRRIERSIVLHIRVAHIRTVMNIADQRRQTDEAVLRSAAARWCTRSTTCRSRLPSGRSSDWSAKAAPASRRSARR